ncbi:MAG: alpha/beta hydrolase [Hyphomicrobiales bacterium]|nr:MAG: alpha/beta hydrolase [Hyphomicrobiales bacterium]
MPELITVGTGPATRDIAVLRRPGAAPGLFWMSGYRSDMLGSKAEAIDAFGAARGVATTRFDYSGHGQSGGDFLDGTISRWLDESLAVFATTSGPQVVIGSSMGGWLALLLNRALRISGIDRVKALILIAPAADMTTELMEKGFTRAEKKALRDTGLVLQPSQYSDQPYPITRGLIEDGRNHLLLGGKGIDTGCPVTILQGGQDPDVPKEHALRLAQHFLTDPVTLTLIPDGDHRLSRPEDLKILEAAIARSIEDAVPAQADLFGEE